MAQPIEDIDVVNLDAMTTVELLRERAEVMASIPLIAAQLMDKDRRPEPPEDDSEAWEAYRDWRHRARWALAHQRADLVTIKSILAERSDTGRAGTLLKQQTPPAEDLSDIERLHIERAERIRDVLAGSDAEAMLLRLYRAVRHLLDGYDQCWPEALDADDREAVMVAGTHLRRQYGAGRVKQLVAAPSDRPREEAPWPSR